MGVCRLLNSARSSRSLPRPDSSHPGEAVCYQPIGQHRLQLALEGSLRASPRRRVTSNVGPENYAFVARFPHHRVFGRE